MTMVAMLDPARWGGKVLPGQNELPSDDGEPLETGFHDAQAALLKDSLLERWEDRRDFFVAGNMFVYFSERQVKHNDFRGPDLFVVLDVERKGRKSWVAWEENGRLPDVVIEITSESTRELDHGEKKHLYAKAWRTPAYFIFDPETETLEGFQLGPTSRDYEPLVPDARGDFEVAPLGLKLGLRPTKYRDYDQRFVRWLDRDGTPLPIPSELREQAILRAEQERQRAEQERQRADAAEARARELETRLRELESKGR